jgi:hypothetical protein
MPNTKFDANTKLGMHGLTISSRGETGAERSPKGDLKFDPFGTTLGGSFQSGRN